MKSNLFWRETITLPDLESNTQNKNDHVNWIESCGVKRI